MVKAVVFQCKICHYSWIPRKVTDKGLFLIPKFCNNKHCNSPYWRTGKQIKTKRKRFFAVHNETGEEYMLIKPINKNGELVKILTEDKEGKLKLIDDVKNYKLELREILI